MSDDLIELFLTEARDLLARAQDDLVALESRGGGQAAIDDLFRAMHTLKGSVAIFDWPDFARMLHRAEDLLTHIRSAASEPDRPMLDALDACLSAAEALIAALERGGAMPANVADILAPAMRALDAAHRPEAAAQTAPAHASPPDDAVLRALLDEAAERRGPFTSSLCFVAYTPHADSFFAGEDPLALVRSAPGLLAWKMSARETWRDLGAYDPFSCNLAFHFLSDAPPEALRSAFRFTADQITVTVVEPAQNREAAAREAPAERRVLRVEAARVDALAHALDELIVARNALSELAAEAARGVRAEDLATKIRDHQGEIARLTARMHAALTSMRLVPLAPALRRLPRLARDLAAQLGKPVDVLLESEEIEADKSIVDGLSEPLLHLLRNALDHGLEPPEERRAKGKAEQGRIVIGAVRSGDHVAIRIDDDGRGFDPHRIRDAARRRGLLSEEALDAMSDQQAIDLVFLPGFSTAAAVSEVSGRGVGMDAVRAAVDQLGGRVEIASKAGAGSTVTLTLPLRVVLAQLVVVENHGEAYGLPMDDVVEIVTLAPGAVTPVRHGSAFVLRDRPVPLISLERLLGGAKEEPKTATRVVVMRCGDEWIGVGVDRVVDRLEAVVRPMSGLLAGIPGFAGTTLLSNGLVLIVLDVRELLG